MKVYVDVDEWYPWYRLLVYHPPKAGEEIAKILYPIEVPDELFQECTDLQKRWGQMQKKLRELDDDRKTKNSPNQTF